MTLSRQTSGRLNTPHKPRGKLASLLCASQEEMWSAYERHAFLADLNVDVEKSSALFDLGNFLDEQSRFGVHTTSFVLEGAGERSHAFSQLNADGKFPVTFGRGLAATTNDVVAV